MVSFLFWNLHKQPLLDEVVRIVANYDVDVVMLAECVIPTDDTLAALNRLSGPTFRYPVSLSKKIRIFSRSPVESLIDLFNDPLGGVTVRDLRLGQMERLILAVVHLPSKIGWDQDDQHFHTISLAQDIARIEDHQEHRRTVLIGDLNMNPFEPGVTSARALHAVMTRELARKEERDVQGESYRFFYNPMWGCFGDRTKGPPGTYYYQSSKPGNFFWNMFDQVLVRPTLMDELAELTILDSDGEFSLLTKTGRPSASDHLPILFRLNVQDGTR